MDAHPPPIPKYGLSAWGKSPSPAAEAMQLIRGRGGEGKGREVGDNICTSDLALCSPQRGELERHSKEELEPSRRTITKRIFQKQLIFGGYISEQVNEI